LSANQYKVSPLRNIKPKPKPISTGNLSCIYNLYETYDLKV
jgi:hypothetical protein